MQLMLKSGEKKNWWACTEKSGFIVFRLWRVAFTVYTAVLDPSDDMAQLWHPDQPIAITTFVCGDSRKGRDALSEMEKVRRGLRFLRHSLDPIRTVTLSNGRTYLIYMKFRMSGKKHEIHLRSYVVYTLYHTHNLSNLLVWPRPRPPHTKSLSADLCRTQQHVFMSCGRCKYAHVDSKRSMSEWFIFISLQNLQDEPNDVLRHVHILDQ